MGLGVEDGHRSKAACRLNLGLPVALGLACIGLLRHQGRVDSRQVEITPGLLADAFGVDAQTAARRVLA